MRTANPPSAESGNRAAATIEVRNAVEVGNGRLRYGDICQMIHGHMFLDVGDCSWEWVQKQRRGLRDHQPSTRRTGCDSQPLAPMSKQVTESTMRMDGSRAASEITRSTSGLPQKPATCNQIEASRQNIPIISAGENVALGALRQKKPTALVLFLLNIFFWSSIAQSPNIKYSYGRPP